MVGSGTASATKSVCGTGTGKKATGKPIKLGGIDMLIPGVDFTTIGKFAQAYFKCVNDNGGINGRPIKYILYNEQLNPTQEASLARKLVESDKVVGIVGNTSFAECGTNWKYYQSKGYDRDRRRRAGRVLRHADRSPSPTWARATATSAPPRRSCKLGAKSLVVASPDTISAYADGGVAQVAKAAGIPSHIFPIKLPITDANSTILQLVQAAGTGGGVILDFTPDSAPALMQAAISQGLVDKVLWGSSTPIANDVHGEAVPAVRRQDAHRPGVRQHQRRHAGREPVPADHEEVRAQASRRRRSARWASWIAKFATHGPDEREGRGHRRSRTTRPSGRSRTSRPSMLCKPWYVGTNLTYHIPNNADIIVTYKGGEVVTENVLGQDAVLPDPGCRPAARADARVGEEVQPEHRREQVGNA